MTLPIATADRDSECRHYFHNTVSVCDDPVCESLEPTSLDWLKIFTEHTSCLVCGHLPRGSYIM